MIAALIRISNPGCSSVSSSSRSRRGSGTRTGSIGASSLRSGARNTAQHLISGGTRSGPYTGVLPGLGLTIFNTTASRNPARA
ncbi:hypothetical protein AB4Y95_02590 [Arthrobacter sp. M-10]|uniref:hypothetical protein n=1 Tax=Arthrobacter sp. M-10 TaxID=3233037 RepID=UPI003F8F1BF1